MKSSVSHIQYNAKAENIPFYHDFLTFMGWKILSEDTEWFGAQGDSQESLWFMGYANDAANDYDGTGVNHLGIGVGSQADVDATASWLKDHGVEALFGTPCHRPDYAASETETYYQVMFESPDRILFEVVYMGVKDA